MYISFVSTVVCTLQYITEYTMYTVCTVLSNNKHKKINLMLNIFILDKQTLYNINNCEPFAEVNKTIFYTLNRKAILIDEKDFL